MPAGFSAGSSASSQRAWDAAAAAARGVGAPGGGSAMPDYRHRARARGEGAVADKLAAVRRSRAPG